MRWFLIPLLLLASCSRESETTALTTFQRTGQMRLTGVVAGQDLDVVVAAQGQGTEQAKETTSQVVIPPQAAGTALGIGGKLLKAAGASGLLGPYTPLAGLVGMALTAAAGYFTTRKKTKQLAQVVQGVEKYKRGLGPEKIEPLEDALRGSMDADAKAVVRKLRGK